MTSVFTYGSLVVPEVWALVAGRLHEATPARLDGYCRRRVRSAPYPGVVPEADGSVDGVLWRDVDGTALERLDDFEGDLYTRDALTVTGGGRKRDAFVYVVKPDCAHLLSAEPWSEEAFRRDELTAYLEGCRRFAAAYATSD